jgi:orotate phosphoribosyltransferase-like protein
VLVTVPGVLTDKLVTEEEPLLVLVNVRDRARCKRESKIVFVLVCDPSIRRIDIEIRVVVGVEESNTPAPACTSSVAFFSLAKCAVAVVLEE